MWVTLVFPRSPMSPNAFQDKRIQERILLPALLQKLVGNFFFDLEIWEIREI